MLEYTWNMVNTEATCTAHVSNNLCGGCWPWVLHVNSQVLLAPPLPSSLVPLWVLCLPPVFPHIFPHILV